ncbi:MAG: LysM peptidoglycan-binding domain-containing protein [Chloroflexi bacterium]|nr:LysM peptidoglycan-binding domain-containing protein [Chloroflexota bacterium]
MSNKRRGMLGIFILVISAVLISACTQSLSAAPAATPTLLPPELFVSPLPSAANPMDQIAEFAKQTSVAQTTVANGGTPGTTQQVLITPTGTIITPQIGSSATPTVGVPSTPTNSVATATSASALTTPSVPNATAVPAGVRPATYILQYGEFPYCIARRFNVNPDDLLSMSGLTSPDLYSVGDKLTIPQSGAFPGSRALAAHPANYTVASGDETVYSVACKFGDVDPAAIATANGISTSAKLTVGQTLKIP